MTNEMLVNNFCRNAISSKNAHFCWMMGRCYPFVETWGSIISKQSNVNQDHSVHEGLYVKVCWGCLKVKLSSAKAKIQSWRKASFIDDLRDGGVILAVLTNGIQFKFARLKLVLLKSHMRWEFNDIRVFIFGAGN